MDDLFTRLFTAVAACEAPEGTQVDDVLSAFQADFNLLTAPEAEIIVMKHHGKITAHCPHCGMQGFYEVDAAERWNPMFLDTTDKADLFFATTEGNSGDGYQTDHFICQSCFKRVSVPEWLETEWV